MGYKIMWLQLLGFSGWAVGLITTCTVVGAAVGFIIGGSLGDLLHTRYPNAARPLINQVSMVLSTPLAIMLYKGMPGARDLRLHAYHAYRRDLTSWTTCKQLPCCLKEDHGISPRRAKGLTAFLSWMT